MPIVFSRQRQAGIGLHTDSELYRFDVNHPDTNGTIEYFTGRIGDISTAFERSAVETFFCPVL